MGLISASLKFDVLECSTFPLEASLLELIFAL